MRIVALRIVAMRIVGGRLRGRRLEAGADKNVRPTSDRAREALFNILGHGAGFRTEAGPLPLGVRVLDAFAGSGALGFEALSRGANRVTFLDDRTESIRLIRRNAESMGELAHVSIRQTDATRPGRAPAAHALVLLDPPYRSGLATPALSALGRAGWLTDDAVAVVELAATEDLDAPPGFIEIDTRRYGAAKLVFLRRTAD